jgi:hypothetical protein
VQRQCVQLVIARRFSGSGRLAMLSLRGLELPEHRWSASRAQLLRIGRQTETREDCAHGLWAHHGREQFESAAAVLTRQNIDREFELLSAVAGCRSWARSSTLVRSIC